MRLQVASLPLYVQICKILFTHVFLGRPRKNATVPVSKEERDDNQTETAAKTGTRRRGRPRLYGEGLCQF